MITNKNKTSIYNDRRFQTNQKQKRATCAKTLFTLSDYFKKIIKTLHGRGSNHIQSTTSMPKYNYIVFSFISRYPHSCAAVIHKSALYYSILCTELCTILWITLQKREIQLKCNAFFYKKHRNTIYNDFSCFCGYAAKKRCQ